MLVIMPNILNEYIRKINLPDFYCDPFDLY